jgi:hypothetical protein
MAKPDQKVTGTFERRQSPAPVANLHPSWLAFIRHCQELGFGEISQLKIQDGVPVFAEESTKKIKFS